MGELFLVTYIKCLWIIKKRKYRLGISFTPKASPDDPTIIIMSSQSCLVTIDPNGLEDLQHFIILGRNIERGKRVNRIFSQHDEPLLNGCTLAGREKLIYGSTDF